MFALPLLLIHQLYLLQAPLLPLALAQSSFLVSCATHDAGRPATRFQSSGKLPSPDLYYWSADEGSGPVKVHLNRGRQRLQVERNGQGRHPGTIERGHSDPGIVWPAGHPLAKR